MEAFVAIEERPMTSQRVGSRGTRLVTSFNEELNVNIPNGSNDKEQLVKMMVRNEGVSILLCKI